MELELLVPYERGDVGSRLHSQDAEILRLDHEENGTRMRVKVRDSLAPELEPFLSHA